MSTLYDVLEVSPWASFCVVRAAYRTLAQHHHPDKHGGDAGACERISLINQAYFTLSDPQRRRLYDQVIGLHSGAERRGRVRPYARRGAGPLPGAADRPFAFRPFENMDP